MTERVMRASDVLIQDSYSISYRPEWTKVIPDPLACLFLRQVIYWHQKTGKSFYKFIRPCEHELYRQGDSWVEELGFTNCQFETVKKRIATRATKYDDLDEMMSEKHDRMIEVYDKRKKEVRHLPDVSRLVVYFTNNSRVTRWHFNRRLFDKIMNAVYVSEPASKVVDRPKTKAVKRVKEAPKQGDFTEIFQSQKPEVVLSKVESSDILYNQTENNYKEEKTTPLPPTDAGGAAEPEEVAKLRKLLSPEQLHQALVLFGLPVWLEKESVLAFNLFWVIFGKKAGKPKALFYFKKFVKKRDFLRLLVYTCNYVLQTVPTAAESELTGIRQRRDPQGWLNHNWWDSEIWGEEVTGGGAGRGELGRGGHTVGGRVPKSRAERDEANILDTAVRVRIQRDDRERKQRELLERRRNERAVSAGGSGDFAQGDVPQMPENGTAHGHCSSGNVQGVVAGSLEGESADQQAKRLLRESTRRRLEYLRSIGGPRGYQGMVQYPERRRDRPEESDYD